MPFHLHLPPLLARFLLCFLGIFSLATVYSGALRLRTPLDLVDLLDGGYHTLWEHSVGGNSPRRLYHHTRRLLQGIQTLHYTPRPVSH